MTQRLFILSPTVVFAARVNQSTFTYDLAQVTFDGVTTGAYTDIPVGATVLFGTSAGSDNRGRQRVRKAATSTVLYFGRSSQGVRDGEVNLADNNYITVLSDYRVWAKIPDMDGSTIYKDADIAYTDETAEIPPKANITGGAVAGTIDGGGALEMNFNGAESYAVAPGATISSYAWDAGGGTITAGSGTNAITAEFDPGFYMVSLTVTDSNGKTHTTRAPVYADDPAASQCVAFECVEHRITQDGQACAFRILEDIPISTYPDGTLVIFWEGEPSNPDVRDNVKFWGWVQTEDNAVTAERTATLKDVTLHCVDLAGRLATLPGFSQSIIGNSAPSTWLEMLSPNMDKFIDYLLRWHSTAFEVGFFKPSGTGSSFPFVILESPGENLWQQAKGRAKALVPDYILSCNRNGELKVWPDPMLQDTGDRTSTSQATIGVDDFTAVSWTRTRPPRVHWIWGSAIIASATAIEAGFCTAPGQAPGQGEVSQQSGYQLTQSQDDLNACEGHRYAQFNAFNGLLLLNMVTDAGIDPADMTWVTFTMASGYTRRASGFTSTRMLPLEINITYEYRRTGMVRTVELSLQEETSGTAAVTYVPPDTEWEPPYIPPIDPPDPPPDPTSEGDGLKTVYAQGNNLLIRTRLFGAASPSWSTIFTPAATHEFYDWILDPFNPKEVGLQMASDGVYISEDLHLASPSSNLIYSVADMETEIGVSGTLSRWWQIKGCIRKQGYFVFILLDQDGSTYSKLWALITEDYGDTWNAVEVYGTTGVAANQFRYQGAMEVSPHLSGSGDPVIYVANASEISAGDSHNRVHRSTDGGATWSVRSTGLTDGTAYDIHVPYNDNPNSDVVFLSASNSPSIGYISTNGGTSWTAITPDVTYAVQTAWSRTPFQSWTQDRLQIYGFTDDAIGTSVTSKRFYTSADGGGSFTFRHEFNGNVKAAGGFPYNNGQFYAIADKIRVTLDGGDNWLDKTGDAPALTFTSLRGGVIVPVWIAE